jgi:hypothetical protein
MPGLVPGIHVLQHLIKKDVDGRDIGERKRRHPPDGYAGHDEKARQAIRKSPKMLDAF